MKSTVTRYLAAGVLLGVVVARPGGAQSAADSAAIRATAMDYIEGWYTGNAERMARALHPDLAKRIVFRRDGQEQFSNMTAEQLIGATRAGGGARTPESQRQMDVTILDVFRGAASVKVIAGEWIDYLHIARYGGRWVIVNVLWEVKDS